MSAGTRDRAVPAPAGPIAARPHGSDDTSPRIRFRRFLSTRMGGVDEAAWYFEQVRPRLPGDEQAQLAAEEVLDHLGRLMGFDTSRHDETVVSTWTSASGPRMRVALVHTRDAVTGFGRATRACEALDHESSRTGSPDGLLCIVCGDDSRDALEHALEVRRMSRPVRLVDINAALALAKSLEASTLSHDLAAAVLAPGASADALISVLTRHTG